MKISNIVLWLFVIFLGISCGAGLYELRVEVPQWLVATDGGYVWNAAAARAADPGLRFWAFVSTGPLTLLTLLSLYFSAKSKAPVRRGWMAATHTTMIERLMTFFFFIPTMIALMAADSSPEVVAKAKLWSALNYVRFAMNFLAWIAALHALSVYRCKPSNRT